MWCIPSSTCGGALPGATHTSAAERKGFKARSALGARGRWCVRLREALLLGMWTPAPGGWLCGCAALGPGRRFAATFSWGWVWSQAKLGHQEAGEKPGHATQRERRRRVGTVTRVTGQLSLGVRITGAASDIPSGTLGHPAAEDVYTSGWH